MGEWLLSRRDSTIVARHEVPGIMRKTPFFISFNVSSDRTLLEKVSLVPTD
jgi:hypothetical protein